MSSFCRVIIAVRGSLRRSESAWLLGSPVPDHCGKREEPRAQFQIRNSILSSQGQKEVLANGVFKWL